MNRHQEKNFKTGAISSKVIAETITQYQSETATGAHNVFLGQVRADTIEGKKVKAIEYTAHEAMVREIIFNIKEEAFNTYDLTGVHIYHSLGSVAVGEICFFVFASSPRRKTVFEAIPFLVNAIKDRAPIFGKEIFEDDTHQWKVNS
jgi:molybdopterin synthase catalytic subunit